MKQNLHLVTLGVADLKRSHDFYTQTLGWKPTSSTSEAITFFQAGGVVLAVFPREELAKDAMVAAEGQGFAGFTLAHNVRSEEEVDEIIRDLKAKGVKILKEPQKASWGGYSSYFADPDGNCWEVAYNPFSALDENGHLKME